MLILYLFKNSPGYLWGMAIWLIVMSGALYGLLRYRRWRRRSRRRLAASNAGLSLWMLAAVLTALEFVFGFFVDFSDTFNITNVSRRWIALHIDREKNNDDFRDRHEFTTFIPKGTKRIVFLGDSFTAGHGIKRMEDRFTDRIAARLEEEQRGKYVVANMGELGWNAALIEGLVKALFIKRVDVSMVIYVYNLNDIEGFNSDLDATLHEIGAAPPNFFLLRDTYFFNWLYFRYVQAKRPAVKSYVSQLADSYRSQAWVDLRAKLSQMHAECAEHAVDFRLVIFPFMQDLGPDDPFLEARAKLVGFCKSEKIPVLDLAPVFRGHAGEHLVVSRFDAHPNERAHAIAAEAIETMLLSDLFRPAKPL